MNTALQHETINDQKLVDSIREVIAREGEYVGNIPTAVCVANIANNPRKHINKFKYQFLKNNIQKNGIDSSIRMRLLDNGIIEVVAGYTRYRIATELAIPLLPVKISILTDEEARERSASENMQRTDMSPIDEGDYAASRLVDLNNDKQELINELGWTESKLNSRLPLSRAVAEVREALANDDIKLGHAQLCVGLSEESQAGFLKLIIDNKLTIEDAKNKLEAKQKSLSSACFDTTECNRCHNNTAHYIDLFDSDPTTKGANCRNGKCFSEKTKAHLELLVKEKQQEFGVARLDKDIGQDTTVALVENGKNGVGADQKAACASCQHYGCVVSTLVGKEGRVTPDVCFNLTCHEEKVTAYHKIIATDAAIAQPERQKAATNGAIDKPTSSSDKSSGMADKKQIIKPEDIFLQKRIKQHAFAQYTQLASDLSLSAPHIQQAVALLALWRSVKAISKTDLYQLIGLAPQKGSFHDDNILRYFISLDSSKLIEIQASLCALFLNHAENPDEFEKDRHNKYALSVLNALDVQYNKFWSLSPEYLALLTKAGIEYLLKDSGFSSKYIEVHGVKEFNALMTEKVKDLPSKIMAFKEFDWSGYLPFGIDYMHYHSSIK